MSNNQPIEVQAREAIALQCVSLFVWEKANATNTAATRKESFSDIVAVIRAAGSLTDGDINAVCSTFGAAYLKAGGKPDTIKVRKSELRRIMEHIHLMTDDVSGWNSAIKLIRQSTTPRDELIRDEAEKLLASIDKANESLNALISSYQDTLNDERPANTAAYTVEQVAAMVRDAIAAKHASAPVHPVNVACLLREPSGASKAVVATPAKAAPAKVA